MDAETEILDAVVIGAGPAGLMAAEELVRLGRHVTIFESKPSPARKLLMAGKSGLNLTKDEPLADFVAQYHEAAEWVSPMLHEFGPDQVQQWARGLGQPVFTGSSGRVFPKTMKASPLLRAWLARIGADLRLRHAWRGFDGNDLRFETPDGAKQIAAKTCVLALGGGSWARLGSDGAWQGPLTEIGVEMTPMKPANMGFDVAWSPHMEKHFGAPVKGCGLSVGTRRLKAEFVVSRHGLEGGGIYALSRELREGGKLTLDLFPDLSEAEIAKRLSKPRGKASLSNHLRKSLRLQGVRAALAREADGPMPNTAAELARHLKSQTISLTGPRPIDEAISTAGGVARHACDGGLMIKPGLFVAGEMLDWEAPTGGYLLTACLATGLWAGRHAAAWDHGLSL